MKQNYTLKLAIVLIAVTSAVMFAFEGVRYYLAGVEHKSEIANRADLAAKRIANQLVIPMQDAHINEIMEQRSQRFVSLIVDSEMYDPSAQAVLVYGLNNQLITGLYKKQGGSRAQEISPHLMNELLGKQNVVGSHTIADSYQILGRVEIFLDADIPRQRVVKVIFLELLETVILITVITMVIYIAVSRMLIKPLESLEVANMALTSIDEGLIYVDLDNKIIDVNQGFTKITHIVPERIIGLHCELFNFKQGIETHLSEVNTALESNKNWFGEGTIRSSQDKEIPVSVTVTEVRNERNIEVCRIYIFQDISERIATEEKLKHLAFYDALTQLPNRRYFEERIVSEIHLANRHHALLGIMYLDLDKFKQVNDTVGHEGGDKLLMEVTHRFKTRLRETDTLCRFGGDEFVVIANQVNTAEDLSCLAQDLITLAQQPFDIDNRELHVGTSIGVSIYPRDGVVPGQLLRKADSAMYHAKAKGRGTFAFYSQEINQRLTQQKDMKKRLTKALKNNAFRLQYQPKIHLQSSRIIGAEALIRWYVESGEVIGPNHFIPFSEETGLVKEIDNWVVQRACKVLRSWLPDLDHRFEMAINLSHTQLKDPGALFFLQKQIDQGGFTSSNIDLEINESSVISEFNEIKDTLQEFRRMGFGVSLDDFGTGFSSLSYLTNLPITSVKIDKSFIAKIGEEKEAETLIKTIITLAKTLNLGTVAEGVESEAQLNFLVKHGCDVGQGYYFARPMLEDDFLEFMRQHHKSIV